MQTGQFETIGDTLQPSRWLVPLAFTYGAFGYAMSRNFAARLVQMQLPHCLIPVDDFLSFVYSPSRHPRTAHFQYCWRVGWEDMDNVFKWRELALNRLVSSSGTYSDNDEL